MKLLNLAYTLSIPIIAVMPGAAQGELDMETALASCREEALSAGLENETDITEYVDLCMQAWQTPGDYMDWDSTSQETGEPPTDTQEDLDR